MSGSSPSPNLSAPSIYTGPGSGSGSGSGSLSAPGSGGSSPNLATTESLETRRLSFKMAKNLFTHVRRSTGELPQVRDREGSGSSPSVAAPNTLAAAWDLPFQMLNLDRELVKSVPNAVIKGPVPNTLDVFNGLAASGQPLAAQVRDCVLAVCRLCELDAPLLAEVTQKLGGLPAGPAELENSMRTFFNLALLEEGSKAMRVLKLMAHAIAAPARKKLVDALQERHPFAEDAKTLCVSVKFNENGHISVIHSRTERSVDSAPGSTFHFIWDCTFIFDTFSNKVKNEINVTEFEFDPKMRAATKRELRELLDPFISQANAYRLLWSRNLLRLPAHKDLARLSNHIEIVDEGSGETLYKEAEDSEVPGYQSARQILTILATRLNDTGVLEAVRGRYDEFVKPEGDLSEQLLALFGCGAFDERSPTVKVLKCINQEIVYPAVMVLRNLMYERFPYKDVKGGWRVSIALGGKRVRVSHLKKEQSHDTSPEGIFGFQWSLRLTFDESMITFDPTLNIVDFSFDKTLPETKRLIMGSVFHLVDTDAMYRRVMQKPWASLPVHRDVLRFLKPRGFRITNQDHKTLYDHTGERNDALSLIAALTTLAVRVETDPAVADLIRERLPDFVREEEGDIEGQFLAFLTQPDIPESSRTMKILKCLHSDLIFPAYLSLRTAFYEDFPFKDVKGSWHVRIQLTPSQIIITHIKRERSHEEPGGDYFEFTWLLTMTFDSRMENFQSEVKITDYFWLNSLREETKAALRVAWTPYVPPSRKGLSVIVEGQRQDVPAQKILADACAALNQQPNLLHAEHPDLPQSTELTLLLSRLADVLSTVGTLPPVSLPVLPKPHH